MCWAGEDLMPYAPVTFGQTVTVFRRYDDTGCDGHRRRYGRAARRVCSWDHPL
jgi:hypothetical protein